MNAIEWVAANPDTTAAFAGLALALVRATQWGQRKAKALDAVATAIEATRATAVKAHVQSAQATMPKAVSDAVDRAVSLVDYKRPARPVWLEFARELIPFARLVIK